MKEVGSLLCLLFFCTFASCSQDAEVRKHILSMHENKVKISLDKMKCVKPMDFKDSLCAGQKSFKYRMIVFVDSTTCSTCLIDGIRVWNPYIENGIRKGIKHIFIVSPKHRQIEDVYISILYSYLNCEIYVDTSHVFRKENPQIPQERRYHSFLINNNDSVVIVGSPVDNPQIDSLINMYVKESHEQ